MLQQQQPQRDPTKPRDPKDAHSTRSSSSRVERGVEWSAGRKGEKGFPLLSDYVVSLTQ